MELRPDGHKERRVSKGEIVISAREDLKTCGKGDWIAWSDARNITYNDVYVTFTAHDGAHYEELAGRTLRIYTGEYKRTEGLLCKNCKQYTATMLSRYRAQYDEYYDHEVRCACGFEQYPTGMLPFILEYWERDIASVEHFEAMQKKKREDSLHGQQISFFDLEY